MAEPDTPVRYTYSASDPDLQEFNIHPSEVEPLDSEDEEGEDSAAPKYLSSPKFNNVSIFKIDPTLAWLVRVFNDLERRQYLNGSNDGLLGETKCPNIWHFKARVIQLPPPRGAQWVLCFWLVDSNYMCISSLLKYTGYDGVFPEDGIPAEVRASAIFPELLRRFNKGFGFKSVNPCRPWQLMVTKDDALVAAMRGLMRGFGVNCKALWRIETVEDSQAERVEGLFKLYEEKLNLLLGVGPEPMDIDGGLTPMEGVESQGGVSEDHEMVEEPNEPAVGQKQALRDGSRVTDQEEWGASREEGGDTGNRVEQEVGGAGNAESSIAGRLRSRNRRG
ncbi:hypothetical protein TWF718_006214 [Orbilia javanica]|uniref:Uncharacterized protein n=1 Tax=Orbilia javanica TaxID=47235 RepID=A0AAN8N4Q9_9PEZI